SPGGRNVSLIFGGFNPPTVRIVADGGEFGSFDTLVVDPNSFTIVSLTPLRIQFTANDNQGLTYTGDITFGTVPVGTLIIARGAQTVTYNVRLPQIKVTAI